MESRTTRYPDAHELAPTPPSRLARSLLRAALGLGVLAVAVLLVADRAASPVQAAPSAIVVNSANDVDDGACNVTHCSLREAINLANSIFGDDEIQFEIPGAGVHIISVGSSAGCPGCTLPAISERVYLRGETEGGPGYAGPPLVELRYCCNASPYNAVGLDLTGHTGSEISGLAITLFERAAIWLHGGGGSHRIYGNYIGINAEGTLDFGNTEAGIEVQSDNNIIGGGPFSPASLYSNVISGNDGTGIWILGASQGNLVAGNAFGTYPDGTTAYVSNNSGIRIWDTAHDNLIGSTGYGLGNTFSGNGNWAIDDSSAGAGNQFRHNSIYANGAGNTGISEPGGVAPPVVTSATWGALAVTPGAEGTSTCIGCTIEVFSSSDCEGRRFEGTTTVTGGGMWQLRATLSGPKITATVTDGARSTSEFSNCVSLAGGTTLRNAGSLRFGLIDAPWPGPYGNLGPHISGRSPGVASDAMFDVRFPGFDPGPDNIVIHATGSDWLPGPAPAYGSEVGRLWVDFDYCGQGHYTFSAAAGEGGLAAGIPLTLEDPASATPHLPAGENPLDIAAAVRGDALKSALYDDTGALVTDWIMRGSAYAFLLNSSLGGMDLVLGEVGSDTRLDCVRITEIRVKIAGRASDGKVFRQNGPAGFYRAFASYWPSPSPTGHPQPHPHLVQVADYVDTNPPPAGFDADGDGVAAPTDINDAIPDRDGDGVYDGIELAAGTDPALPDSDFDGVLDPREVENRTTSVATNDFDGDGAKDTVDDCPRVSNVSQADLDNDGEGDLCDNDIDGDGLTNAQEATMKLTTIAAPASKQALRCDYGTPTLALIPTDRDTDNDGWSDGAECALGSNPLDPLSTPERCNSLDDDLDGRIDESPLAGGLFLTYGTGTCPPDDPDGDGAMGITEWKIGTMLRIGGEWEDLPPGALSCGDPNVECDPDNDSVLSANDFDSDNDGLSDLVEFGQYGSSPASNMSDGDACPDGKEPLLVPPTDPTNPWDFYSVPVPALLAAPNPKVVFANAVVSATDAQTVFAYFKAGASVGETAYEQDLNENGVRDGLEYDRKALGAGKSGAPDGAVSALDAQTAFAQFLKVYNCN